MSFWPRLFCKVNFRWYTKFWQTFWGNMPLALPSFSRNWFCVFGRADGCRRLSQRELRWHWRRSWRSSRWSLTNLVSVPVQSQWSPRWRGSAKCRRGRRSTRSQSVDHLWAGSSIGPRARRKPSWRGKSPAKEGLRRRQPNPQSTGLRLHRGLFAARKQVGAPRPCCEAGSSWGRRRGSCRPVLARLSQQGSCGVSPHPWFSPKLGVAHGFEFNYRDRGTAGEECWLRSLLHTNTNRPSSQQAHLGPLKQAVSIASLTQDGEF